MPFDYEYSPTEIAELLIEMLEDMDCNDYMEQREETASDLTEILLKIQNYGGTDTDFKFLYKILNKICETFDNSFLEETLI